MYTKLDEKLSATTMREIQQKLRKESDLARKVEALGTKMSNIEDSVAKILQGQEIQIQLLQQPVVAQTSTPTLQLDDNNKGENDGELDNIDLINLIAAELELKEKKKRIDERIAQVFGSTAKPSETVKHVTQLRPLTLGEMKSGKGAKGELSISNELKPIVVFKPKPSTFRFSSKHPMEFDYSPPGPDEQKLMKKSIASYKTTKDALLRKRIAKIYRYGKLICIMNGHPKFVEARHEEDLRLKTKSKPTKKQAAKGA
ncbi:hypothetical protein AgCh_024387 [Apium graveolens]